MQGLDVVGLGDEAQREGAGRQCRADEIGAELEQAARPQCQDLAGGIEGKLAVVDHLAAAWSVSMLRARGRPHRAAQATRRPQHERIVGKDRLEPETAADVGRHDPDLVLRHVEDVRHLHARAMRVLAGQVQRVVFGRGIVADRDPRLHGDEHPIVLDPQLHHVLGAGECCVGRILVAEHQPEADIALRAVLPDLDRAVLGGSSRSTTAGSGS